MKNKIVIGTIIGLLIIGIIVLCMNWPLNFKKETSNKLDNQTQTNIDGEPINQNNNEQDKKKEEIPSDMIGKWNTTNAVNGEDGTKTTNMQEIFGSSFLSYGSYLELKEDGTFVDAIQPITNGNTSTTGEYSIKTDYNKPGDCYVFLSYSDGREGKLQKVILDESNTPYLVLDEFINGYQLYLKK